MELREALILQGIITPGDIDEYEAQRVDRWKAKLIELGMLEDPYAFQKQVPRSLGYKASEAWENEPGHVRRMDVEDSFGQLIARAFRRKKKAKSQQRQRTKTNREIIKEHHPRARVH